MQNHVNVAIVGAGSAGLSALRQVRKLTDNYLLMDPGPLGTTCARVGCMPSKALIHIANDYHRCASYSAIPNVLLSGNPLRTCEKRTSLSGTLISGNSPASSLRDVIQACYDSMLNRRRDESSERKWSRRRPNILRTCWPPASRRT